MVERWRKVEAKSPQSQASLSRSLDLKKVVYWAVEALDVLEDSYLGIFPRGPRLLVDQFLP